MTNLKDVADNLNHLIIQFYKHIFPFLRTRKRMLKPLKQIKINKSTSTSIVYRKNVSPLWISDNQLNYMSQYDFMSYDLDEDNINIIQKPFPHQVIAVKYFPTIGYRNLRVIYLHKDKLSEVFYFVVLPSLNFSDDYSIKRIDLPLRRVAWVESFLYFNDGQFVIFPTFFDDGAVALVCMSLVTNKYFTLEIESQPIHIIEPDKAILQNDFLTKKQDHSLLLEKLKNSCIIQTKQSYQIIFIYNNHIHLIGFEYEAFQLRLLQKLAIRFSNKQYGQLSARSCCSFQTKLYLVLGYQYCLYLYCIENDKLVQIESVDVRRNGFMNPINCITGSLNSNKIVVSFINSSILAQYSINDMLDSIEFVNRIDFQIEGGGYASRIILSETGRNVAVFQLGQPDSDKFKHESERNRTDEVISYSIFKIQLFTELGIPDCSLCIKQPKYKNRNKRVNRLVIPKIYEKIYSLTGSEVHTLQSHKMSGVLFFDVHPYGFYMAVSYSFNIKIYSIESTSMTLLYSMTFQQLQQQLKKILYSPDGSNLVVFSSRRLKVLDAFSFDLKYQINEKSSVIVDAFFALKRNTLLILFQNGMIVQRNFYNFQKSKTYRIFCQNHRKFLSMKMEQKNQNIYLLLEDGSLIIKHASNVNSAQICVAYEDEQKISEFYIEARNNLIFTGTRNGILRIHNICSEKFSIRDYIQIYVSESEITAIASSYLENCLYVGNIHGDITIVKYNPFSQTSFLAKSSKVLRSIAPKISPSFSFDFELISTTKFQGNSQQNALQDKLQNLIQKIHLHTANFKKSLISSYQQTEKSFNINQEERIKALYKQFDSKTKKLKLDRFNLKERNHKNKKQLGEEYEQKVKKIFCTQRQLEQEREVVIKNWEARKNQEIQRMSKQKYQYERQLSGQIQNFLLFYKKQQFVKSFQDFQDDFRISSNQMYRSINENLRIQLASLKQKCLELNKSNSYLQTAKINILCRKVQEETLEHRIKTQLRMLDEVRRRQSDKIGNLSKQLSQTQQMIHYIQNKVKNTPNNAISSDKADSDLCSYKIWMKNKVQQQLTKLQEYLDGLDTNFDKKSQQIVIITNQIKTIEQRKSKLSQKHNKLRQKMKDLRYKLIMIINNNINVQKNLNKDNVENMKKKQNQCQFDMSKTRKILAFEKLNQKALFFENKNLKIHTRKIRNLNTNNAQLLHQYQKLKYQNKLLLNKQKQYEKQVINLRENAVEKENKVALRAICSQRTSLHKEKETPFKKYIRDRASKTKRSLNCLRETATTSLNSRSGFRSAATSRIL